MALVRKNGMLVEVSDEEARQLQGLSYGQKPPVSPTDSAAQGQTPDEAKMAGTPNQKTGAVDANVKATETLEGTKRLDQGRQEMTAAETSAADKSIKLGKLGSLQSRVEQLAQQQMGQLKAQAGGTLKQDALAALPAYTKLNAQQKTLLDGALAKLMANPGDVQALAEAKSVMGQDFDPASVMQTQADLGAAAAGQIMDPGQVTMGTLDVSSLGLNEQQLTDLLGPSWKTMTMKQLQDTVASQSAEQFSNVSQLQAELADPMTSPARKQQIAQQLKGLGQVGVTTMETNVQQTMDSIGTLDQTTQDLLNNENITKAVQDYLTDPTTSDLKTKFPGLASWADQNAATLKGVFGELTSTGQALETKQAEQTAGMEKAAGGADVSALSQALGVGTGMNTPEADNLINVANKLGKPELMTWANNLAQYDPKLAKELGAFPADQLSEMARNGSLERYATAYKQLSDFKDLTANTDQLLDFVFGVEGMTAEDAEQTYADDLEMAKMGDRGAKERVRQFQRLLDTDKDGTIDDGADVLSRVKKAFKKPTEGFTLEQQLKGSKMGPNDPDNPGQIQPYKWGLDSAGSAGTKMLYGALSGMTKNPNNLMKKVDQWGSMDLGALERAASSKDWTALSQIAQKAGPVTEERMGQLRAARDGLKEQLGQIKDKKQRDALKEQIKRMDKGIKAAGTWAQAMKDGMESLEQEIYDLNTNRGLYHPSGGGGGRGGSSPKTGDEGTYNNLTAKRDEKQKLLDLITSGLASYETA